MSVNRERHHFLPRLSDGMDCIHFRGETPKIDVFPVDTQLSHPLVARTVPRYPSVLRGSRRIAISRGDVLGIGVVRKNPQVVTTVIKPIAISVIDFESVSLLQSKNLSMKVYGGTLPVYVTASKNVVSIPVPASSIYELSISGINKGVGSNAAISGTERYADSGIIGLHRTLQRSGVTPPAASNSAGVSRVNYTSPLRVEAAT